MGEVAPSNARVIPSQAQLPFSSLKSDAHSSWRGAWLASRWDSRGTPPPLLPQAICWFKGPKEGKQVAEGTWGLAEAGCSLPGCSGERAMMTASEGSQGQPWGR